MQHVLETFRPDLFAGRHVVVSGATSGIGLAIARGFAGLGAEVTGTGSSAKKLEALAAEAESHPGVRFVSLDVRDRAAIDAFAGEQARIDVVVNAAGIARPGTEWNEDTYLDVIDVNLNSAFRFATAARGKLKASGGSVINVASMLSYLADVEVPAYTASKTGILGLTRALAHAFGPEGIRVNAIAPGYHTTDMTRPLWSEPVSEAAITRRAALKRWGTAEDLVGATLFLASPAAAFVTGVCLEVDGGYVSGNPMG